MVVVAAARHAIKSPSNIVYWGMAELLATGCDLDVLELRLLERDPRQAPFVSLWSAELTGPPTARSV